MKPKIKGNEIELLVVQPIYTIVYRDFKVDGKFMRDPEGRKIREQRDKFLKEVYIRTWMDRKDISSREEYIGVNNEKLTARIRIFNRVTQKFYNIAHSMQEIESVLYPESKTSVGFKPTINEI